MTRNLLNDTQAGVHFDARGRWKSGHSRSCIRDPKWFEGEIINNDRLIDDGWFPGSMGWRWWGRNKEKALALASFDVANLGSNVQSPKGNDIKSTFGNFGITGFCEIWLASWAEKLSCNFKVEVPQFRVINTLLICSKIVWIREIRILKSCVTSAS